jgi:Xaa-Pro dipeptidase
MTDSTLTHISSPAERERRYSALRAAMAEAGLDALLIAGRGDEFLRGRIQYVSDAMQWAGYGYVVLPASGEASYIGDPLWGTGRVVAAQWITNVQLTHTPGADAAGILCDHGLASGRIGLVGGNDAAPAGHVRELERALPKATIEDATDLFDDVRVIKSAEEIANLRQTSSILDRVFAALRAELRPGVLDRDVLAEAHRVARQFGCVDGIAIMGRAPHEGFTPGAGTPLRADDTIVIDLEWGGPSGYWLEHRRNFCFGRPSDALKRFWEVRLDCYRACVEAIRPGAASTDILTARDAALARHGYPPAIGLRYTAHGLGLDSLEPPWVPGKNRILEPGMMLSLHPDILIEDAAERAALGGISIADNVLVTETGAECMTEPEPALIPLYA